MKWKPQEEVKPILLPREWKEIVRRALQKAGYESVEHISALRRRGQFYISSDSHIVAIRFKEGIYPHNVLGFNPKEGTLINLQVERLSGRTGCTLVEMSQLLASEGAEFGIGIDQGGGPHLMAGNFAKKSFLERWRISAALVFVLKQEWKTRFSWNGPTVWAPLLPTGEERNVA